MKLIVTSVMSCLSLTLMAQKVDKTNIEYTYLRNPLERLDENLKNYQVDVNVSWEASEREKEAAYQAELQQAEEEFQAAQQAYEEKSTGSKLAENILLGERKPQKRFVEKPTFIPLPDAEVLKSKIKLDGFTLNSGNALQVKIVYQDIFLSIPEDKVYSKDGKDFYEREIDFKQPVELSVINPNGETLFNEIIPSSNKMITAKSGLKYVGDWDKFLRNQGKSFFHGSVKKHYRQLTEEINSMLNHTYGYSHVTRKSQLYMGKGKKFDYTPHLLSSKKAQRALENITTERENSIADLQECISAWEAELATAEPQNKKARISGSVSQALRLNIIEAKILMGDYQGATDQCDLLDVNPDLKGKYKRKAEALRKFLKDEKLRNPKV